MSTRWELVAGVAARGAVVRGAVEAGRAGERDGGGEPGGWCRLVNGDRLPPPPWGAAERPPDVEAELSLTDTWTSWPLEERTLFRSGSAIRRASAPAAVVVTSCTER